MSINLRRYFNSRGDTIVEVLIAMTVVSAVLGGAYATVNKSLNNARQAQERSEGLKLVESQIERLKALAKDPSEPVFTTTNIFCVSKLTGKIVTFAASPPIDSLETDNFASYPLPDCNDGNIPGGYNLSVEPDGNIFTFRARWIKVGGAGREEVTIIYRLYDETP